ncbi:PRC-barrel domain-containing protein [Paenarthrobacter sp. NPDC058040]|uniref:PRC-barrel domain-containing protein n=1 Tax=unclassified Paenarthrobacter TaxID=2634190 RepID=UPI0036DEB7E0
MLSLQDLDQIVLNGGIVVDSAGEKIGSVEQVFLSGDSGDPAFVTVRTGFFGMSESFAPLAGAHVEDSTIKLAVAKERVEKGPRIDNDRGSISESQEKELYDYFGLVSGSGEDGGASTANGENAESRDGAFETPAQHHPVPPPPHLHKHVPSAGRPPGPPPPPTGGPPGPGGPQHPGGPHHPGGPRRKDSP